MAHITLPAGADGMVIAPATANIIGKFARGIADDLLITCLLSFRDKAVIIDRKKEIGLSLMSKDSVADAILDRLVELRA